MKNICTLILLFFAAFVSTQQTAKAEDRALIVGTDIYANPNISQTDGAAEDAGAMRQLLIEKFGFIPVG